MREHTRTRAARIIRHLIITATAVITASTGVVAAGSTVLNASPPTAAPGAAVQPPAVHSLDVPAAANGAASRSDRRGELTAALAKTPTEEYGMVAVTWRPGTAPEGTEVRVRSKVDGAWTAWTDLPVDDHEGPSADEESGVRDGTSPMWVGAGTGIAVEVTSPDGSGPRGVRVETIDPGSDPAIATGRSSAGAEITRAVRFPGMPRMLSRRAWGANESLNDQCWRPIYGSSAKMVFVHHTVNSNNYSPSEGKAIVRGIHAYHTQSRGWCDIGYNFLIDKYGKVYVGRAGGARRPVRGAHAGDYNTNSVGVSLIGNFEQARPTKRMKNALVRFIGWRLGTSYAPARGTVRIDGTRFKRISGHRDADATACPGRYVYRWLPRLRDRVAKYLSAYRSSIRERAARLGKPVTGEVFRGEARENRGRRTDFGRGAMFAKVGAGTHWLTGPALRGYRERKGTSGRFGFPTTDVQRTNVPGVRRVVFEHGQMYRIGKRKTYTLWGRILIRYRDLGGIGGRLGLPTSNMVPYDRGRRATFANGVITWDRRSDEITVEYA
jgi:N-acetylmuramoyl-L-alanine amidase/LGFP repeat